MTELEILIIKIISAIITTFVATGIIAYGYWRYFIKNR
jgi:hypothetical protein